MRKLFFSLIMLLPVLSAAEDMQPLDKVVAVVNNDVITASELDSQVNNLRQQLSAKKTQLPPEDVFRKQVLQHLIDVELQMQLAKTHNLTIDNAELDEAIFKIAKNNKISVTKLREELSKQGLTWPVFRENIRKEMLISRVQQKAVGHDVSVSAQQIDDYLKTLRHNNRRQQSYHLQNIVIPLPEAPTTEQLKKAKKKALSLLKKIKAGEDFSRLAIAESSGEYALEGGDLGMRQLAELPEVFAEKATNMKKGEIAGPIRTGNGYQLIKLVAISGEKQHHEVVKSHVRHILVKQDASTTETEAKKQVENIYLQLQSGKAFATMARQYSVDAASAVKGGDLGWVTADALVPQFAKAMNALPVHQVSKPVKSTFGWHLIEVLERKKIDDSNAFQRQQVAQLLQQRKFAESVQNWLQHLRGSAYIKITDPVLA